MELTGQIKAINPIQIVSDKFSKRELILITEGSTQYPQFVKVEFTQDKCNLLDSFKVGQDVKVGINIRGREYNGANGIQYFVTIQGWSIKNDGVVVNNTPKVESTGHVVDDDLPF